MKDFIYLDYAATTPVDPKVKSKMLRFLNTDKGFGNPASRHHFGLEADKAVENAREQVAELINADPVEIVWTSGATESDNLAIKGVASFYSEQGKRHIVTSAIEHKAVLDTCGYLEGQGFEVTYITPGRDGIVTPEMVGASLRDDTVLVSLMHVNNEIGTITDIKSIGEVTKERGVVFHVDAAQSVARLPIDLRNVEADLVSLSGHKMYGPKGIGALYVKSRPRPGLFPQMHGGGHEGGFRSGTIPTHQVVGMGEAARAVMQERDTDASCAKDLSQRLLSGLEEIDGVTVNGNRDYCVDGIINVCFSCVDSESMMVSLDDIAVSSGSACTSADLEPSHVLLALGMEEEDAFSSLRFSIGRFSTKEEIDHALRKVRSSLNELRDLSPLWNGRDSRAIYKVGYEERRSVASLDETSG